ncbi:Sulfotransferase family protein [Nonomuraea maritima]|uniref:Sulfotransferase family protein n=1 Tax=Nonomuraea maritima TaxID=683260 RepID=A0A1G9DWW2_9ACTN|nr:sulfotransferase [Nonomuraea maritima]SDK68344.1 Sulfotransferase family protein [Nonomuraea maritima]
MTAEPTSPQQPIRILFVGGHGRSGSTLVSRALGAAGKASCVGELRYLWKQGVAKNQLCGCNRRFARCAFWQDVGDAAFGGWRNVDAIEMAGLHQSVMRIRHLAHHLLPGSTGAFGRRVRLYAETMAKVYRGIAEVSGSPMIVDSSKFPTSALLLRRMPGIDLRIVQLVRGPHGVVHSWSRTVQRADKGGRLMATHSPTRAAAEWLVFNAAIESFRLTRTPWTLLRYEDFVARPHSELSRVLEFAGSPSPDTGFLGDGTIDLPVDHSVAGNPMRIRTGVVPLRADEEWRTAMRRARRRMVTVFTAPGMLRYGYPLR